VQRDRLRTDVRMKLAGKWDRSRYGEKVEHAVLVAPVFTINIVGGVVERVITENES